MASFSANTMSVFQSSVVRLLTRSSVLVLSIFHIMIIARFLEPADRGEYFLFHALVSLLTVFSDFGLSQSASVFCARHPEHQLQIHRLLLKLVFILWIITGVVAFLFFSLGGTKLIPNLSREWLWLAIAVLPLTLYGNFWTQIMVGAGRLWRLSLVQLFISIVSFGLVLVFVAIYSYGLVGALAVYAGTMFLQFLTMVTLAAFLGPSAVQDRPNLSREMFWFGLHGYPNALSTILWMRATVFLLNVFHGPVAVGIFSVAQQLAEKLLLPIQAIQDTVYSKIGILSQGAATLTINRYLRLTLWGMVPLILLALYLAPWLTRLLFGDSYAVPSRLLRLLIFSSWLMTIPLLLGPFFLSQLRRPGLLSVLAWANVLIVSMLSLLLIPSWGELGAACALALTQLVGTTLVFCIYLRITSVPLSSSLWPCGDDVALILHQAGTIFGEKKSIG